MDKKIKIRSLLYFTLTYILIFTLIAVTNKNYEFLYYTGVILALIAYIIWFNKKFPLSTSIIAGLSLIAALHIFGGNIHIDGIRLYDIWFIGNLLRYDNFVHLVATFIVTLVAYSLLAPYLDKKIKLNKIVLSVILILIALGVGAINEIIELLAVVLFGAAKEVGDYMNNAIDLVYNLLGSLLACLILMYHHRKLHEKH